MTSIELRGPNRRATLTVVACLMLPVTISGSAQAQHAYTFPQEAVEALVSSVRSAKPADVVDVLGTEGHALVNSGDPVADVAARERFLTAYEETHEIRQVAGSPYVLYLGHDDFPFPIPLVEAGGKWHFDTPAGAEEIFDRRIGENELAAIGVMRAYVDAQREYAAVNRDGHGVQYARKILSSDGTKDGLYWPTEEGAPKSPLGALIAAARAEGYVARNGRHTPYHGYIFKVLTAQGDDAPGGAQSYIVNGRMIGGFGLVATPAEYGNSGIMTFVVNHDGVVYEKGLGPEASRYISNMTTFDPDASWSKVADEARR